MLQNLKYIAGLDITYSKIDSTYGIVAIAIFDINTFPDTPNKKHPKTVYTDLLEVKITVPYSHETFTERELPHYITILKKLKAEKPQFYPDIIIVDGCGIMCDTGKKNLATCLGKKLKVKTFGVAKKFADVGEITHDSINDRRNACTKKFDQFKIHTNDGKLLGMAMKATDVQIHDGGSFVYISRGYKTSLKLAVELVRRMLILKQVEPVRIADLIGRTKMEKIINKDKYDLIKPRDCAFRLELKNRNLQHLLKKAGDLWTKHPETLLYEWYRAPKDDYIHEKLGYTYNVTQIIDILEEMDFYSKDTLYAQYITHPEETYIKNKEQWIPVGDKFKEEKIRALEEWAKNPTKSIDKLPANVKELYYTFSTKDTSTI